MNPITSLRPYATTLEQYRKEGHWRPGTILDDLAIWPTVAGSAARNSLVA